MKPGKHQRSKRRSQDLCWKVRECAQSFVLCSYTMHELRSQDVSLGWFLSRNYGVLCTDKATRPKK